MTFLQSVVTQLPRHSVLQEDSERRLLPYFVKSGERARLVEQIFRNANVERRGLACPQEFYLEETSLTARNDAYVRVAREIGLAAARRALEEADVAPREVDLIIDTSCNGRRLERG